MAEDSLLYEQSPSSPVRASGERRAGSFFPFATTDKNGNPLFSLTPVSGTETASLTLEQTSPEHARSRNVVIPALSVTDAEGKAVEKKIETVLWGDEYGGLYGVINIKGNDLSRVKVTRSRSGSEGFRVDGLLKRNYVRRIAHASGVLRSLGIETEVIEEVLTQHEFIVDGNSLTQEQLKGMLLEKAKVEIAENERTRNTEERAGILGIGGMVAAENTKPLTSEDLDAIQQYLEHAEFSMLVRGLQVNERFRDLGHALTQRDFEEMMRRVFAFTNVRDTIEADRQHKPPPRRLDPHNEQDVIFYFTDALPKRLAGNIAKLHSAGIAHGFLSGHNGSLVGSIYDLDSLKGKKIFGEEVTVGDLGKDMTDFVIDVARYFYLIRRERIDSATAERQGKHAELIYLKQSGLAEKIRIGFFTSLFSEYLKLVDISAYLPWADTPPAEWFIGELAKTFRAHKRPQASAKGFVTRWRKKMDDQHALRKGVLSAVYRDGENVLETLINGPDMCAKLTGLAGRTIEPWYAEEIQQIAHAAVRRNIADRFRSIFPTVPPEVELASLLIERTRTN